MATDTTFTTYASLVDMDETSAQNVQELASIWGEIENELADIDVEVEESYAVLGEVDFLVVFEAPTNETAFKADVVLERHGLDVQTMELTPTSQFSELVHDV
jgi:uncharacterized protein with GYD domain